MSWCGERSLKGDAAATIQLHDLHETDRSKPDRAFQYLTEGMEAGHALSAFYVGECYRLGLGTARSDEKAVAIYKRLAEEQKSHFGAYGLAKMFESQPNKQAETNQYFQLVLTIEAEAGSNQIGTDMVNSLLTWLYRSEAPFERELTHFYSRHGREYTNSLKRRSCIQPRRK